MPDSSLVHCLMKVVAVCLTVVWLDLCEEKCKVPENMALLFKWTHTLLSSEQQLEEATWRCLSCRRKTCVCV